MRGTKSTEPPFIKDFRSNRISIMTLKVESHPELEGMNIVKELQM